LFATSQALKSKAFNNFTAIYFLLLQRWRQCTRLFSGAECRLTEDHRRPSTVAEQAVVRFAVGGGSHPPSLSDTRTGPFSRTTDGITPVELGSPMRATHQQRIYTAGPRLSLAKMSIDEGVELEGSYETLDQPTAAPPPTTTTAVSIAKPNLISLSSSGGSSDAASFDSVTDMETLAGTVQLTPWAFTSGEYISSAMGPEFLQAAATGRELHPADGLLGTAGAQENRSPGRCFLAVPGPPVDSLQVPNVGPEGGRQDGLFHSGRRASDGLVTRGDILQLQQLMKTRGVRELQKELELLPVPIDPGHHPPRVRRAEPRSRRPLGIQLSFEEGSCGTGGRLSPQTARRSRQAVSYARPRLSRGRHPAISKSPLAELTTLCRMLPSGATSERSRSPLGSEHWTLQQQFQQLGLSQASAAALIQLPVCEFGVSRSDHRLAVAAPPTTTEGDISSCRSQDSIHSSAAKASVAPAHLPVGQPAASMADEGRRHMVRRTLFRLAHQQTLISSFGEEDIPEVSPVSEQAASPSDGRQPANSMDVT